MPVLATGAPDPDSAPALEVVSVAQSALIQELQIQLRQRDKDVERLEGTLEKREQAFTTLKKDHDKITHSIRYASTGKMDNLIEEMDLGEGPDDDEDEKDETEAKPQRKLPSMPFAKGEGNWGVFPDRQWREMLVTACYMRANKPNCPTNRVVVWPELTFANVVAEYFLLPYILWDPPKMCGVKAPLCPGCKQHAMRGIGWAALGPRICYTVHGVVLILARQYRCGDGRGKTCGTTHYATQDVLLRQWPPAVATAFPYLQGKKFFVEERLADAWLNLYTSSNISMEAIAAQYSAGLADEFYRRATMFLQRSKEWSVWTPRMAVRYHEAHASGQQTLDSMLGMGHSKTDVPAIMAMLQMEALPTVFTGPSHDFVRHMIDVAAGRRQALQDAAMAAQVTEFTMKGDHTFKVAALGQTTLGTPFTAFHTLVGDAGIILSCVFAKDEAIESLEEQHAEVKDRCFRLARALPRVYAVDKCCQFKSLIKQLQYSPNEVSSILESLRAGGMDAANLSVMADKLTTQVHLQLDQMHLVGRTRRTMPSMNASQKGYFFKYCALFWEILDSSLSKGDWRKVPQSKRRIINPAALVERMDAFYKAWDTEGCMNADMRKQLALAREHAEKGCISDVPGVPYTWTDRLGVEHTNRGTSIVESWHKELNRIRKSSSFGIATMAMLVRNTAARWNMRRHNLVGHKEWHTENMLALTRLREALCCVLPSADALFANAYLPPMKPFIEVPKFYNLYEHVRRFVRPEHVIRLQADVLIPALTALFAQYSTYTFSLEVASNGPTLRALELGDEVHDVERFTTSMWFPYEIEHQLCFTALITGVNLSVDGHFDEATLFAALTSHVEEYGATYDAIYGISALGLLETAKTHLPVLGSTTYTLEVRPALLFVFRAVATMCGVPILVFRQQHGTYYMDLVIPCILLDNVPKYTSLMILACNGACNIVPCLLRQPMDIQPSTHSDVISLMRHSDPTQPAQTTFRVLDITDSIGKRIPDLNTDGALGTQPIKTTEKTAKFCAAKTPPKDSWSPFETVVFLSYGHKCLKSLKGKSTKKQFDAHKMFGFWAGLVARQDPGQNPDKILNARTVENLHNKWATCLKGEKYETVMRIANAKDAADEPNLAETEAAVKRGRDATTPARTTPATAESATPVEAVRDSTTPPTQGVPPPPVPASDVLRQWMRTFLGGKSKHELTIMELKTFREAAEVNFQLQWGTLGDQRHVFEQVLRECAEKAST